MVVYSQKAQALAGARFDAMLEAGSLPDPSTEQPPPHDKVQRLKKYDRHLGIIFDRRAGKWLFFRSVPFECGLVPWPVFYTDHLSHAVVDKFLASDTWREGIRNVLQRIDYETRLEDERQEKKLSDDIRHATLDNIRQLKKVFGKYFNIPGML